MVDGLARHSDLALARPLVVVVLLECLGTQIGPRKVIFDHFIDFGHFPIKIPIEAKKIYQHGKELS